MFFYIFFRRPSGPLVFRFVVVPDLSLPVLPVPPAPVVPRVVQAGQVLPELLVQAVEWLCGLNGFLLRTRFWWCHPLWPCGRLFRLSRFWRTHSFRPWSGVRVDGVVPADSVWSAPPALAVRQAVQAEQVLEDSLAQAVEWAVRVDRVCSCGLGLAGATRSGRAAGCSGWAGFGGLTRSGSWSGRLAG